MSTGGLYKIKLLNSSILINTPGVIFTVIRIEALMTTLKDRPAAIRAVLNGARFPLQKKFFPETESEEAEADEKSDNRN